MNTSSRPRGKPLRTYGKRSSSTPDPRGEGPSKKQRTAADETGTQGTDVKPQQVRAKSSPRATTGKQQKEFRTGSPSTAIKKGSIMNYFKPIASALPTSSSSPASEEAQPVSSPPSSPPPPIQPKARRKPRLLRFRGTSLPIVDLEEQEDGEASDSEPERDSRVEGDDHSTVRKLQHVDGKTQRPPLQDGKEALSNQCSAQDKTKKIPRSKSAPSIQTTLNISAQAAFSECKVCNTVWNPLHPDDVKYHLKQHAAVLRAKKKQEDSEL